jgi:DNA-binding NarL/FixJ family response regulator
MQRTTVAIVDDHPLYRKGVRAAMAGHDDIVVVATVGTAAEALTLCESGNVRVFLLDLNLPDTSGIEAARRIRELCPDASVIALTAHDDDQHVIAMAEAGAVGYLLKTASDADIVGAVRDAVAGRSSFDPAVTGALLRRFRGPEGEPEAALTDREKEVLAKAAEGLTNRQIGKRLDISERTVQAHLSHIFDKLGVGSRTEAVTAGLKRGVIELPSREK